MSRLRIVPLGFLVIGASFGLLVRWHLYSPVSWLKFPHWLHAHSHLLILGWIFNVLLLIYSILFTGSARKYRTTFIAIQFAVVAMAVAFTLQGYGFYSIFFSAIHLVLATCYLGWIYLETREKRDLMHRAVRFSVLFCVLSAIGPLMLGPLSALGSGQSIWKSYLVHFYLHLQFNGVFLFGVIAVFLKLLASRSLLINVRLASPAMWVLAASAFPTYFLSIISKDIHAAVFVVAPIGAIGQVVGLILFLASVGSDALAYFSRPTRRLFIIAVSAFALKSLLQLTIAVPDLAVALVNIRSLTIAYLHLVLIGFLTSFLLGWYVESVLLSADLRKEIIFFVGSFIGLEAGLALDALMPGVLAWVPDLLVLASSAMLWSIFVMFFVKAIRQWRREKQTPVLYDPDHMKGMKMVEF